MSGFYYLLPGVRSADAVKRGILQANVLRAHGLDKVFGNSLRVTQDASVHETDFQGRKATVIYLKPVDEIKTPVGYYAPDKQTWLQFKNFWIGYDNDSPPDTMDLIRAPFYAYAELSDGFGSSWYCPVVRGAASVCGCLPTNITFDGNGDMQEAIKAEYQDVWELAGEVLDSYTMWPPEKLVRAAIRFLQVNYKIGPAEIMAMTHAGRTVMDTERARHICLCSVEHQLWEDVQKKSSLPESSSSSLGQEEQILDTDPVGSL